MADETKGVDYRHTWRGAITCDTCDARIEGKDLSTEADLVRIELAAMEARAIRAELEASRVRDFNDKLQNTLRGIADDAKRAADGR